MAHLTSPELNTTLSLAFVRLSELLPGYEMLNCSYILPDKTDTYKESLYMQEESNEFKS